MNEYIDCLTNEEIRYIFNNHKLNEEIYTVQQVKYPFTSHKNEDEIFIICNTYVNKQSEKQKPDDYCYIRVSISRAISIVKPHIRFNTVSKKQFIQYINV